MTTDLINANAHQPTSEFRDYLDAEISHAYRRERGLPRLRIAAAIIVSLAIGLTTGLASAQVRDSAQRDSLLEAAQADAMLVKVRLDLARAQLAEARRSASIGATASESTASAENQVSEMELQLAREGYNIAEIKESAKAPRNELNAPLVNGRDYMKDRLNLRLMSAQRQMQLAEAAQVDAARRVRAGIVSDLAIGEAEVAVARTRRDIAVLAERLNLRNEYLAKNTSVDVMTRRLDFIELQGDAVVSQAAYELARARVAFLEKRRSASADDELEVMKANVELKERVIELRRLARRLQDANRAKPE